MFLLFFLLPVCACIILIVRDFESHLLSGTLSILIIKVMAFNLAANLLYLIWVWAVGEVMQKKIPDTFRDQRPRFRLFFILQWVLLVLLIGGIFLITWNMFDDTLKFSWLFLLMFPLSIASLAINAFFLYYASKIIKTAELQREVTFKDHTNEFIMLWFYPIGVWFIQPLINKLGRTSND